MKSITKSISSDYKIHFSMHNFIILAHILLNNYLSNVTTQITLIYILNVFMKCYGNKFLIRSWNLAFNLGVVIIFSFTPYSLFDKLSFQMYKAWVHFQFALTSKYSMQKFFYEVVSPKFWAHSVFSVCYTARTFGFKFPPGLLIPDSSLSLSQALYFFFSFHRCHSLTWTSCSSKSLLCL